MEGQVSTCESNQSELIDVDYSKNCESMCSSSEEDNNNADEDTYMYELMYDSQEDESDDTETNHDTVQKSNEDKVINSYCKLYDPAVEINRKLIAQQL